MYLSSLADRVVCVRACVFAVCACVCVCAYGFKMEFGHIINMLLKPNEIR